MSEYAGMTIQEMLRAYNTMAADAQLAGLTHYRERRCFKDRSDAEKSLAAIASSMRAHKEGQRRAGEGDVSPGLARLRADPRAERLREEVLADQATASALVEAVPPTVPQEPPQAYPAPAIAEEGQMAKKAKKESNGTGRRGRAPAYGDDATITKLVDGNPKREGTKSHEWFAAYRSGMKVATLCEKLGRGVALANLRWDVEKGYVAVE